MRYNKAHIYRLLHKWWDSHQRSHRVDLLKYPLKRIERDLKDIQEILSQIPEGFTIYQYTG